MANQKEQTLEEKNIQLEKELANKIVELNQKNRELEIENSLERVRAVAMLMKKPDDLLTISKILFEEFRTLGFSELRNTMININYDDKGFFLNYDFGDNAGPTINKYPYDNDFVIQTYLNKLREKDDAFVESIITGDELETWKELRLKNGELPDPTLDNIPVLYYNFYSIATGAVGIGTFRALTEEKLTLLKRFRNVFDLAYRRYIDIKNAEAQARQAQIEVSLERVRTKAMSMQKSDDLALVVATIFEELDQLHLETLRCGIGILNKETRCANIWTTTQSGKGNIVQVYGNEPMDIHPLLKEAFDAWVEQREDHSYVLEGEDLVNFYKAIANTDFKLPDSELITSSPGALRQYYYVAVFQSGNLYAFRETPFPDEAKMLMKRFAKVFDLTYTRFLDLQKAEAQAREAKIEAALERVRSRTMAMQRSDELQDAASLLFKQVQELGIPIWSCGYNIFEDGNTCIGWMSMEGFIQPPFKIPLKESQTFIRFAESRKNNEQFYVEEIGGAPLEAHYKYMLTLPDFAKTVEGLIKTGYPFPSFQINHVVNFSLGNLIFISSKQIPEAWEVFKRFANVFEQTYIRFRDLQQAEAQAREATIEAALEKVRGKAMAMQNSNDLSSTASMVFAELRKLGINPIRCGVGLLVKESRKAQLYSATSSTTGDSLALMGWVILSNHPVLENIYESWVNNEDYFPELSGEQLGNYYELLLSGLSVPKLPDWQAGEKQYGHFIPFSVGCLYAWSANPYNETELKILKRFATIIDLTFRRYMELQKSEANAREAVRQASLDRVRAEIASMRTTHDLEKIIPLIWNELTILDVPFIRCGVFIMDDEHQLMHSFLSTPDGKAIAAFHLPYTIKGNIAQVLSHWQHKKMYAGHWDESDFSELAHILLKQGSIDSEQEYLGAMPQGGFYLHFLPFLQGMLYVGNTTQLDEEAIKLIQSIADAFSTAYARYEDFNKLEAAKQQVEKTLTDLKQAQTQLVQAEKMASLGELTAGIAHEIQNPLNFVNNFSEVSNELLDEMKSELDKGNTDEAMAIAKDLQQNLEKILNHGKRADAIVKGMLQHSRTSGGQKESTDINVLADEYLRLTYHGLRAKDKTFNATMKTNFDNTIGKINIVPQDIGRMLLNIYNNAFYAVGKKKSQTPLGYDPVVSISTKKLADKVEIRIKDNGNGIPQKILDKIFQPFFTTKPTGQGTGLGLSLAYDIVKAHSGEIRVETKEAEGAEFVVELPANKVDS